MAEHEQLQKKASSSFTSSPKSSEFLETRPFAPQVKSPANLQTKSDRVSRFGHSFANLAVSSPTTPVIQPKLTIGQPGDKYEQEADRVAADVVQRINQPQAVSPKQQATVQRQEVPEEEELQMKQNGETVSNQAVMPMQLQAKTDDNTVQQQQSTHKKENNTGLPDNLKTGMENLSGISLDDVKVHRNSDKPAQLQAHAYAHGTDIHLGPGQEKHLPHEAWHVVQQKQGRVKPTLQMKGKVNINDDAGLEKEADVMGERALQSSKQTNPENGKDLSHLLTASSNSNSTDIGIIQGQWWKKLISKGMKRYKPLKKKLKKQYKNSPEMLPEQERSWSQHQLGPVQITTLFKSLGGQESKFERTLLKLKADKSFNYIPLSKRLSRVFAEDMHLSKEEESQLNLYFQTEILGAEKSIHPLEDDSLLNLDFYPKLYLFKLIAGGKKTRFVPSMWGGGVGADHIETMNEVEWEMGINPKKFSLSNLLAGETISMFPVIAHHNIRTNPRLGSKFGYSIKSTGDSEEIMDKSYWQMFFPNVFVQKFDTATKFELDQIPIIFNDLLRKGAQKRYESSVQHGLTSSQETDVLEVYQILEAHDSMLAQKQLPKLILASRNEKFPKHQQESELPSHMIETYRDGAQESRQELFELLAKHGISWPQLLIMIVALFMFQEYMKNRKNDDSSVEK